jgi:hypothetical protein
LDSKYIYWPDHGERKVLEYKSKNEVPMSIAWMDGTDIKLTEAPSVDRESFFDKNRVRFWRENHNTRSKSKLLIINRTYYNFFANFGASPNPTFIPTIL